MKQVKVFEESRETQWDIICGLWDEISKAKFPHFLFENKHILIRYEEEKHKFVKRKLKKYKTEYSDSWEEWSDVIIDNWAYFSALFYIFSSLAIENKDNEDFNSTECIERIYHCSYNMMTKLLTYKDGENIPESSLLSHLSRRCAINEGYLYGKNEL